MSENQTTENLKWMYEGKNSSIDHEQYLLGKRITSLHDDDDKKGDFLLQNQSSIATGNVTVLEKLDYESKVREDPLFQIRKNDYEHRKEILSNPLKKKRIQKILKQALEKDLKKSLSKRRESDSDSCTSSDDSTDSSTDSDDGMGEKLSKKSLKNEKLRNALKKELMKELAVQKPSQSNSSSDDDIKRKRVSKDGRYCHMKNTHGGDKRHSGDEYESKRHQHKSKEKNQVKKRSRSKEKHTCRDRKRSRSSEKRPEKKAGYGLIYVKDQKREEGRKRRERKTPTPEPDKPKYVRKHKPGFSRKLSERELEKKRREMMENAQWRDDQRKGNIKKFTIEETKERAREEKLNKLREMDEEKGGKARDFLHDMKLHSASVGSLSDTVRRKKHTLNKRL